MKIKIEGNRGDTSIQNVLRMLRPVLEDKGIIGTIIKATDLARLCRRYEKHLPVRPYLAKKLAEEIRYILPGGGLITFDDLEIEVYYETNWDTRRETASIEFQRSVSLERQYLDEQEQAGKQPATIVNQEAHHEC